MRPSTAQAIALSTFSKDRIVDVLDSAAAALVEKGWCQGKRMDARGRLCILGSVAYAINPDTVAGWGLPRAFPTREETRLATICHIILADVAGLQRIEQITSWNDRKGRGQAEVVELLWNSTREVESHDG